MSTRENLEFWAEFASRRNSTPFENDATRCWKSLSWNDFRTNGHSFSQSGSRTMTRAWYQRAHFNISCVLNHLRTGNAGRMLHLHLVMAAKLRLNTRVRVGVLWR